MFLKILELKDVRGNQASYELCLPESMTQWQIHGLLDFLLEPTASSRHNTGYLAEAPDPLRHETLRRLVCNASSTFHRPISFVQNGVLLNPFDSIDTSEKCTQIILDRDLTLSRGNPAALSLADCNKRAFKGCQEELIQTLDSLFCFAEYPIFSRQETRIESFHQLVNHFDDTLDSNTQLRVLYRVSSILHAHPFENISKLTSGTPFCSGWEMWGRMAQGGGGICAEKTGALKFICDILNVPTFYVAASQYTIPDDFESQLRQYVQTEGNTAQPVWIQHLLLGFRLGEDEYLTDVSNGNLPLIFLSADDTHQYLNAGYRARMVFHVERMNLKRISTWAGDAMLTLCEFHVPDLHFQYIFKQALGLHISSQAYVGAFFDYGGIQSARYQSHYSSLAKSNRLPYPRFIHEANLQSLPDEALQATLKKALQALRDQYENPYYTGDFTFVIQPLNNDRWQRPRISENIRKLIFSDQKEH